MLCFSIYGLAAIENLFLLKHSLISKKKIKWVGMVLFLSSWGAVAPWGHIVTVSGISNIFLTWHNLKEASELGQKISLGFL